MTGNDDERLHERQRANTSSSSHIARAITRATSGRETSGTQKEFTCMQMRMAKLQHNSNQQQQQANGSSLLLFMILLAALEHQPLACHSAAATLHQSSRTSNQQAEARSQHGSQQHSHHHQHATHERQQQQQHQRSPEQQQQHQQQRHQQAALADQQQPLLVNGSLTTSSLNSEISCDELNLIVLAQLQQQPNIDNATQLNPIGCRRNLNPRSTDGNGTLLQALTRQQQVHPRIKGPEFNGNPVRLHFGAKVALLVLLATILLVISATLFDLNSSSVGTQHLVSTNEEQLANAAALPLINRNRNQKPLSQQQNNLLVRDQRSPSLSSSNSSTGLFCSGNSLASASVPILGYSSSLAAARSRAALIGSACAEHSSPPPPPPVERPILAPTPLTAGAAPPSTLVPTTVNNNNRRWYKFNRRRISSKKQQQQQHHHQQQLQQQQQQQQQQYQQNLQMLFASSGDKQPSTLANDFHHVDDFRSAGYLQLNGEEGPDMLHCDIEQQQQASIAATSKARLAKQLFLAFSLRHSFSIIFQRSTTKRTTCEHQPVPRDGAGRGGSATGVSANTCHRSRLASLSSITERLNVSEHDSDTDNCSVQQVGLQPKPSTDRESIDSLHGLRFLSMLWIVVIHSYDFARRWSFFTDSSTFDMYKTAASPLLANGTFACDSFFFASGFLLPYLAFPAKPSATSSTDRSASKSHTRGTFHKSGPSSATGSSGSLVPASKQLYNGKQQLEVGSSRSVCSSPDQTADQHNHQEPDSLSSSDSLDSRQSTVAPSNSHLADGCSASANCAISGNASGSDRSINGSWHTLGNKHDHEQNDKQQQQKQLDELFTLRSFFGNILHRYIRMMPLMMAIIGFSATLLRYLGEGPIWEDSTMMFDKWCRSNWWINAMFLHNFINRENMCLSHSWYSAVDIQLFLLGQLLMLALAKNKLIGLIICCLCLAGTQLLTGMLTLIHHLPAVPLVSGATDQALNLYYGEIYIKPYCRASPYLIGILLAYMMRTTNLGKVKLSKWQVYVGWTAALATLLAILLAMQPAMNGHPPGEVQSALYSALSRPLWACATGWMIFACITKHGGIFGLILNARIFVPLSRLTYPAFLIHPIVMAVFYGSRQSSFQFSHYLMLYLILGNIVITYACAFVLSALFELPLLSMERVIKQNWPIKSNSRSKQRKSTGDTTNYSS